MPSVEMQPTAAPSLSIPSSDSIVTVHIIDSTTKLEINPEIFWRPTIQHLKPIQAPIFCFLISHGHQHLLFDLGVRRDWQNYSPNTVQLIRATTTVHTEKNVSEILDSDASGLGIRSADISAIIWSHSHFDHIGDPSTFPQSTTLVVGPGVKAHCEHAYPCDPSSALLDSDGRGRPIYELDFQKDEKDAALRVGRFPAIDYFRDGSFYLLNAPGHAVGHICALARVTSSPDSFIFMGADACHHAGLLRPNEFMPLPPSIRPPQFHRAPLPEGGGADTPEGLPARNEPFLPPSERAFPAQAQAKETLRKIVELDAQKNVFVVLAHDTSLEGQIDLYPTSANKWMEKGWKRRTRWLFCNELCHTGRS